VLPEVKESCEPLALSEQSRIRCFFIAATKKDLTMFRLLLHAGADVNVTKARTQTPAAKDDIDFRPVIETPRARVWRRAMEGGNGTYALHGRSVPTVRKTSCPDAPG
jgi:hypothetical protein